MLSRGAALLRRQRRQLSTLTWPVVGKTSPELIAGETAHVAHNYHPLPVVFSKARGARVWDPEGREYLDFLSAYSAVNQGHCHPEIVGAAIHQLSRITLSSRAFHNDQLPGWAALMTSTFGYDAVLPMNTGAEAVETAVKLARRYCPLPGLSLTARSPPEPPPERPRRYGSLVRGVPDSESIVLSASGAFHGRTLAAISLSNDESATAHHAPVRTGFGIIPFGDVPALRRALEEAKGKVVAFIVEPIQATTRAAAEAT